jgi:hypothetical protein
MMIRPHLIILFIMIRGIPGLEISPALHRLKDKLLTKSGSRLSISGFLLENLPSDFVLDFVRTGPDTLATKISLHHLSSVLSKPLSKKEKAEEEATAAFKRLWPSVSSCFALKQTPCSIKAHVEVAEESKDVKMKENNDETES